MHRDGAKKQFCTIIDSVLRANIGIAQKWCYRWACMLDSIQSGARTIRSRCAPPKGFVPLWHIAGTEAALSVAIEPKPACSNRKELLAGPDQPNREGGNVRRNR
jgi:hypothetical protein